MELRTIGKKLAVVVAVLLCCVLVVLWFTRDYRPTLDEGQRFGVDVSRHQGDINWSKVANDRIEFAYIKATEGGDWVDPNFADNWRAARDAGIDVSAYHFFTECRSGAEQAANFLKTVPVGEADLPLALDLEFADSCEDPMTPEALRQAVAVFVSLVEAESGREMLIYLLPDFAEKYGLGPALDRPRWVRRIVREPSEEWMVWQYSYTARVNGISGGVDLNVGAAEL